MEKNELQRALVKAKVLNVTGGETPQLLVLVKEFSYTKLGGQKSGKIVFDDYSHQMAFYVKDENLSWDENKSSKKVSRLVYGDIITFFVMQDEASGCYGFTLYEVERKHESGQPYGVGMKGLAQLVDKYGKDD